MGKGVREKVSDSNTNLGLNYLISLDPNFLNYKIVILILGDCSENGEQIFVENLPQCLVNTRIVFPRLLIVMQDF